MALLSAWTSIVFWLAADLRVQQVIGGHVLDFLPYLYDAARAPLAANHAEWSGDTSRIALAAALVLAAVVAAGGALWWICRTATSWCARRLPLLAGPIGWGSGIAAIAVLLMGLIPVQGLSRHVLLLRTVKANLPVPITSFDRLSSRVMACLGGQPPRQVCIVSLLANPAGDDEGHEEVHLHNFSPECVALDGWHLENRNGSRHQLSGELAPGQTRVIVLPEKSMPLRNGGDAVRPVDMAQRRIHQVSYGAKQAKYGRLMHFRDALDYDDFERSVNASVQASFRELHPRLAQAKPVDDQAAFERAGAPNVILIVLESLRHSAIGPEMMSQLDAWGGQGLRLQRHYAGSNASHLGLFAILYGRSPLVYDATLDARVPPQLPIALRRSGYETMFLTSGDCQGFRRMGDYLNGDAFDHTFTDGGEVWQDRPLRDRRILAQVRRLATEQSARPRFIMAFLMSTHFPYSFSDEFAERQPCGENIDYSNWTKAGIEVLRNRYHNAARFLESELMRTVAGLDPRRNLIIITGDHGESLGEDGALAHCTRGSEIQLRVPFLMVGGGVPQQSIQSPTTHMDILPTLLHALAGSHVHVAHSSGRDLLNRQSLSENVLLCPYRWSEPGELLLICGQERMQFNYRLSEPEISAFGFCTEAAALELGSAHDSSPEAAAVWADTLRQELGRIAD
jgi:hypothetical protein